MRLTNKLNLPEPIMEALRNDGYSRGDADASVTQLLDPPKVVELNRRHHEEQEEDASERIWSLFGQAVHTILEKANRTAIAERRLSIEVEGWKISGGMDIYEVSGILSDYKTVSVWKLMLGGVEEWTKQLNLYAVLLRAHGHKVEKLQAVAFCRDWRRGEYEDHARKASAMGVKSDYPEAQVVNINIPVWEPAFAEKYLRERVILHKQARLSGELPDCSADERWNRSRSWAVKKIGGKRAVNGGGFFRTEEEARTFIGFDKNLEVEYRPGKSTRCLNYCNALNWCKQGQDANAHTESGQPDAGVQPMAMKEG